MNKLFIILVVLATSIYGSSAQHFNCNHGVHVHSKHPVCYASDKVEKSFIPPPTEFLTKSGEEASADIVVRYSLFPPEAKDAFEYAVSIWESIIESDMPIRMKADWRSMSNNVLGSCGPEEYYSNFNDAPEEDRYYPVAIAEKIANEELNGVTRDDIVATFNKNITWYFGTDGNTPDSLYDFVTVVLHEIGHGLGFTGFFHVDGDIGSYGYNKMGDATSYDALVEKSGGKQLVNPAFFDNASNELKKALEASVLFANSPVAMAANNGVKPRLYAPSEFDDGSSIYHLNDGTYPSGSENSLMTHAIGKGEAIHDPGPLTRGMMEDIGWTNLFVRFNEPKDIEQVKPITFSLKTDSKYAIDSSSVYAIYSDDNFESNKDTLLLNFSNEENMFTADLTPDSSNQSIYYFIEVRDVKNRVRKVPAKAPVEWNEIKIGPDNEKPVISHTPITSFFLMNEPLVFNVNADDNFGIDTVYIEYSINGIEQSPIGLNNQSGTLYSTILQNSFELLNDGDSVAYQIVAKDSSNAVNLAKLPQNNRYSFKVDEIYEPVKSYSNDFNEPTTDFVISDFDIYTAEGFENEALHSPHPYPSPNIDNKDLNFTTFLKKPIIINELGEINYDEVVLVEPGEPNSVFGDDDFWDYVILEGSKDYGKTWLKITSGYDSGDNDVWQQNYNANIVDQVSQTTGNSEWFVNRTIKMGQTGNFAIGDTILIRFRLYSDPYAHGWGWAIDNLKIQYTTSSNPTKLSPGNILVYPNPFKNLVNVKINGSHTITEVKIDIYNMFGQRVYSKQEHGISGNYSDQIDLWGFKNGIYLIRVSENGRKVLSKKLIKN